MLNKLKFYFFGKSKVLLAFEYGVVMAETANELKFKTTPELMKNAEAIIVGEFSTKSVGELATDMGPNILSAFELDLSK